MMAALNWSMPLFLVAGTDEPSGGIFKNLVAVGVIG